MKFKKLLIAILIFVISVSFVACAKENKNNGNKNEPEPSPTEKIVLLTKNYKINNSNGFIYSVEQKVGNVVTNSHLIKVNVDNSSNSIKIKKIETIKSLNENIFDSQYTTTTKTTYYFNNKMAENINGSWTWKDSSLNEFLKININSFNFDGLNSNMELLKNNKLVLNVPKEKIKNFLGISNDDINDLVVYINANEDCSKLKSLTVNYRQNNSKTTFNFNVLEDGIKVELPN